MTTGSPFGARLRPRALLFAAALLGAGIIGGCGPTLSPHAVPLEAYDPFERYPLGHNVDCSLEQPEDERSNPYSATTRGFGCSHQGNFGAMIANPRDLHEPQPLSAADPVRRAGVLEAYREGQDTSSQTDAQGADSLIDNVE